MEEKLKIILGNYDLQEIVDCLEDNYLAVDIIRCLAASVKLKYPDLCDDLWDFLHNICEMQDLRTRNE